MARRFLAPLASAPFGALAMPEGKAPCPFGITNPNRAFETARGAGRRQSMGRAGDWRGSSRRDAAAWDGRWNCQSWGRGARSTTPCMEFRLTRHLGCLLAAFALILLPLGSGARAYSHDGHRHAHQHVQQHDGVQANHARPPAAHHARMDAGSADHAARDSGVATHAAESGEQDGAKAGGGTFVAAGAAVDPPSRQCLNCGSDCNCSGACVGACHMGCLGDNGAALAYAAGVGMVLPARAVALRPWSTPPRPPPPRA